ncbi:MAG: methyltransferase domain-containing protein [Planctomycetota bacterium]|jgi:predicted SAM-dependent methyltransferase
MVNFANVGPPTELISKLRDICHLSTFVETGTYKGGTACWASRIFDRVITIEASEPLYKEVAGKYGHTKNVEFIHGDSREELWRVVTALDGPGIFWLDAHWSGKATYGESDQCPLMEEIRIINSAEFEHFILIDDARYFTSPPPDPHPPEQWPNICSVINALSATDRARHIVLFEDVIISVPGPAKDAVDQYCRDKYASSWKEHSLKSSDCNRQAAPPSQVDQGAKMIVRPPGNIQVNATNNDGCVMQQIKNAGLWQPGQPLRLHLGCGQRHYEGYINIDFPSSKHNVIQVKADACADIRTLVFPAESVDEIRLHHVFEHFSRVVALAMLIKWHRWLKVGARLHIETPDLIGSAKTLASDASWKTKMGVVRHLAGDQTAEWGYHIDHWFPERFGRTLERLGFELVETVSSSWPREPYLSNVKVVALKSRNISSQDQLRVAEELLAESTVATEEKSKWEIWKKQLHAALAGDSFPSPSIVQAPDISSISQASTVLSRSSARLPLEEIQGFNQRARNRWVQAKARTVPAGSRVLDVGAGTCPYRSFFDHCDYKTQDFKKYEGIKKNNTTEYGQIDYVSDISSIPVPDGSFDVILCTEVLEHVLEPIKALSEMVRIVRPGGRLLITAPLGSGLHQLPYHFYGGLSPEWYKHFLRRFNCDITEITPNGGFFKLLAQECARVVWTLPQHQHLHGSNVQFIRHLFGEWIPRYLFALEDKCFIDQFTVGYHVEGIKRC